jgi:hypothetical protein
LDEAVARLSEADRNAIVLRYYQKKPLEEVGRVLGLNADTAQKRVSRAIGHLRTFFKRRGVTLSATAIAGAVSGYSVQAAPVGLEKTITVLALAKGTAAGGSTLTLVNGALKIMAWPKVTIAVGALVGVGITTTIVIGRDRSQISYGDQTRQASSADEDKAIAISQMNHAKQLVLGMLIYAHDHGNELPTNLQQMAGSFRNSPQAFDDLDQFEIVYHGSLSDIADPNSIIIVRDRKPWLTSHKTWAKTYGFADGHTAVQVAPFEAFEQSHMNPTPNP